MAVQVEILGEQDQAVAVYVAIQVEQAAVQPEQTAILVVQVGSLALLDMLAVAAEIPVAQTGSLTPFEILAVASEILVVTFEIPAV